MHACGILSGIRLPPFTKNAVLLSLPVLWILLSLAFEGDAGLDDRELAQRIRAGDAKAFRVFFDRHHGKLYGYLLRRGVPGASAEDIIQNAFLAIWERRDQIDEGKSLRAFLYRIGHNRALNYYRDTAKFVEKETLEAASVAAGPETETTFNLMQQTLHQSVATLPKRRRAVFELCFM